MIYDFRFWIEPPLAPPWEGGGCAVLLHWSVSSRWSLPLCKGELVGVVFHSKF